MCVRVVQCVPSRSSMMAGLRTDQIKVYDNFFGVASTNGDPTKPDTHCAETFGADACTAMAKVQGSPKTWIDRAADAGVNVTLFGKMHVGGGLDTSYPGELNDFPFNDCGEPKCQREWMRGVGSETNTKGLGGSQVPGLNPPSDMPRPATAVDYKCLDNCVRSLDSGTTFPVILVCGSLASHVCSSILQIP